MYGEEKGIYTIEILFKVITQRSALDLNDIRLFLSLINY